MKLVREHIEFKQGGDPYSTLGIGKRAQIEKWFKTWAPDKYYTIEDDDLNINVRWSLNFFGTNITSLPNNLTVGGYLDLNATPVTSLPNNLTVKGYLDIQGTQITSLPSSLNVQGTIYKDF